jgi:hypothetical protein
MGLLVSRQGRGQNTGELGYEGLMDKIIDIIKNNFWGFVLLFIGAIICAITIYVEVRHIENNDKIKDKK